MAVIIALNHKSNLKKEEYIDYIQDISTIETNHQLIICPSFINIGLPHPDNIILGAQNVSSNNSGAHTGEISPEQLKSHNIRYTIIGHSERRQEQKESLEDIHQKMILLQKENIIPILCIGETQEERSQGKVEEVLEKEIKTAVEALTKEELKKIVIAYEPIWSIGTGLIPSNKEIDKAIHFIKKQLPQVKVLYGGSVNEENIDIIKSISCIDGYLLGGLSLHREKLKILLEKID